MAFGFGFNKAKVLASAEKNVKAGKLQNAIADYEKIVKEDPKDLTVLNTIGDLYSRLGNTGQATSYYKRVGDAFASNGFTVKAIAMYKKISKLDGSVEVLNRLAELYAQQGLHNDARSQYALVAEHYLKAGSLDRAATIFQKVLDLDPENANMQAKLADLYVRLGKKNEARDIYLRNAELYRSRKNFAAADESLKQVLDIDKDFSQALLLRGLVKIDLGDPAAGIECLEKVSDLDSRPEALRSLLKAYFALGKLDSAGPLARKLYTVFHETQGLNSYGEALVAADKSEEALALYSEFADVLLSSQQDAVIVALQGCIGRVKDNPAALEQLSGLLERAGQTTHLAEIKELLAHACVQSGDLVKARELYRELARIEPDNPLHTQNYRQVLAKLGEDPAARALSAEEAAQPMLVDELEGTLPEIPLDYAPEIADAIRAALTEAELFDSYNLPAKAITPLEAVLGRAPFDPQLNQRLASLYARTSRFADAAERCRVLDQVYKRAGYAEKAHEYAELASKYAARGGTSEATSSHRPTSVPPTTSRPVATPTAPVAPAAPTTTPAAFGFEEIASPAAASGSVAEFEFVTATPPPANKPEAAPVAFVSEVESDVEEKPAEQAQEPIQPAAPVRAAAPSQASAAEFHAPPPAAAVQPPATTEFDLSAEWEDMVEVEAESEPAPAEPLLTPHPTQAEPLTAELPAAHSEPAPQFALEAAPTDADAAIFEMLGAAPESGYPERVADLIEEIRFYASQGMWDEAHAGIAKLEREAPEAVAGLRRELQAHHPASASVEPAADTPFTAPFGAHDDVIAEIELEPEILEHRAEVEPYPTVAETSVAASNDADSELQLDPLEIAAHEIPADDVPVHAVAAHQQDSVESLLDLDSALGDDFEIVPAMAAADTHAVAASAVSAPPSTHAAAAAASAAPAFTAPPTMPPPPISTAVESFVPPASSGSAIKLGAPVPSATPAPTDTALDFSDGALADIFEEFKNDMEGSSATAEDPETHYNLGVAFKEMGLLDEAIGELQKVCQAIDRGEDFPQALQAYTWLADCFVQKGVPEVAIRWYEKALRSPHVQAETATAIHYELACACEQAGNRTGALSHFMEVYGTNIDYRDVAERIKSLKS